jgi:hypothetical protein
VCCHLQHQGAELVQGAPYPRGWMLCERAEGAQPGRRMPPDSITADRTTESASGLPYSVRLDLGRR